ncbi:MAG: ThiF family adenylyltransferase [Prevotella sp.]|nr:ThiF family adenylyltransferase [Prevotella sp.]
MLDVKAALDACYKVLSREFDIEEVDSIPNLKNHSHVRIWKIQITALVAGRAEDVEAYIRYPKDFPYSMPCVILLDDRFKYLPHISVGTRKLCLYEDDVVYDAENIEGIIRDNIEKTRKWIEHYYGRDNTDEYVQEIRNYWNEDYEDEAIVSDYWTLVGEIPVSTCEMIGLAYAKRNFKDGEVNAMFLVSSDENNPTIAYFKDNHETKELSVIYLASLKIPNTPPYCMTGQQLIDSITEADDRVFFKSFINSHGSGYVLFPIGLDYALGGVHIYGLKVNRNGYRKGMLKAFTVLTQFENKNKKLDRLHLSVYNDRRMAERTAGGMMTKRSFLIAGLGSIGSNLCYYLNGYNNAEFTLADRDWLSVDNIGRHLLGFESIGQHKVHAVANYLQQYRPDRNVVAYCKYLQQLETEKINEASAIFVCTGDVMSEKWLLDKMDEGNIDKPAFLLWLEPYGISGIMIYVNPDDKDSIRRLKGKAADSFLDYCLIKREEYDNREKLTRRDVGCNGSYALYSANDVTMFLSAVFPIIDQLLDKPSNSCCRRWVGNVDIATARNIELVSLSSLSKGMVQSLPL